MIGSSTRWFGLVVLLASLATAACKKQSSTRAGSGTGSGSPAAGPPLDAAPPPVPPPAGDDTPPSLAAVARTLAGLPYATGPAVSADRAVWCTQADNGMAPFVEVVCQVAHLDRPPPAHVVLLPYDDAVAIDEGSEPDAPDDARARAAAATARLGETRGRLIEAAGAGLTAVAAGAPTCVTDTMPGGDPGERVSCQAGGVELTVTGGGKLTVAAGGKPVLTETAASATEVAGDEGEKCTLDASGAELLVAGKVALVKVTLSNPSDMCAMVTEYALYAVTVP